MCRKGVQEWPGRSQQGGEGGPGGGRGEGLRRVSVKEEMAWLSTLLFCKTFSKLWFRE